MRGPFFPGLYWHRWGGGWTIIAKAGIREYRRATPDGLATKLKLWGHVVHGAHADGRRTYPGRPGLRLSRAAWKEYAPWKPEGLEVRFKP